MIFSSCRVSNRKKSSFSDIDREDLSRWENRGRYILGLESHADRETFSYPESD